MANKKYRLTVNSVWFYGVKLYRIEALADFATVTAGTIGGFVESEFNLSHSGECWISQNAKASGNARVSGNAWLMDNAQLRDNAKLSDAAMLYENARAFRDAHICEDVQIFGDTAVGGSLIVKRYARIGNNEELMEHVRSCL
jgi:UDP-3-O-[3-hydroxymyristoyl] glucosamine N-acyltransferase